MRYKKNRKARRARRFAPKLYLKAPTGEFVIIGMVSGLNLGLPEFHSSYASALRRLNGE